MQPSTKTGFPPRLAFISDLEVDASAIGGHLILHRLLAGLPPDRLQIVELRTRPTDAESRLKGVCYHELKFPFLSIHKARYIRTLYRICLSKDFLIRGKILSKIKDFQPEAILTVADRWGWIPAWKTAQKLRVPLHLILHDVCHTVTMIRPHCLLPWAERQFGGIYREAASRMCISPYMAEHFEARYGAKGTVLYPSRAADIPVYNAPPDSVLTRKNSLRVVYIGNLNYDLPKLLMSLARLLAARGSRLRLYSYYSDDDLNRMGIDRGVIEVLPFIPAGEFYARLRKEADVLLVPASFQLGVKTEFSVSFPSKLADYTVVGLPILIWGPPYYSGIRWANEHPGAAECVATEDPRELEAAVSRLLADPQHRFKLAATALRTGAECFSYQKAVDVLLQALRAAPTR